MDHEVKMLGRIGRVLAKLDRPAQLRALAFFAGRFSSEISERLYELSRAPAPEGVTPDELRAAGGAR
jgi:hypothetical protein